MAQTDGSTRVSLERIAPPENVRALDERHVEALAASIALRGLIVPLVVRPADEDGHYTLVPGFHRYAALCKLGRGDADVVVRSGDSEDEAAVRAIENIARKQLDPYQEACAVRAMLARGLSEDGAAQALGWPRRRLTQRAKLRALPDDVARGFGDGRIAVSDLDTLLAVNAQAPGVAGVLGRYLLEHAEGTAMREPGWTLQSEPHALATIVRLVQPRGRCNGGGRPSADGNHGASLAPHAARPTLLHSGAVSWTRPGDEGGSCGRRIPPPCFTTTAGSNARPGFMASGPSLPLTAVPIAAHPGRRRGRLLRRALLGRE